MPVDASPGDFESALKPLWLRAQSGADAAIVLTKLKGLSVAEAAARTGALESAIRVQVHRGHKRLAALVRKDD